MRTDRLADRAERAASVRKRPPLPPVDELGPVVNVTEQLPDEPALADPRRTDERDELSRALAVGALERVAQQPKLDVAADERRAPVLADVGSEAGARLASRATDAKIEQPPAEELHSRNCIAG